MRRRPAAEAEERKAFQEKAKREAGEVARVKFSPNARKRALSYFSNVTDVMPSPLRMIAAMTIKAR